MKSTSMKMLMVPRTVPGAVMAGPQKPRSSGSTTATYARQIAMFTSQQIRRFDMGDSMHEPRVGNADSASGSSWPGTRPNSCRVENRSFHDVAGMPRTTLCDSTTVLSRLPRSNPPAPSRSVAGGATSSRSLPSSSLLSEPSSWSFPSASTASASCRDSDVRRACLAATADGAAASSARATSTHARVETSEASRAWSACCSTGPSTLISEPSVWLDWERAEADWRSVLLRPRERLLPPTAAAAPIVMTPSLCSPLALPNLG
mmetsp:Transcript_33017/g.99531  ORF Transcript_33017/g.99531 Transcript_33017/m.99531 type:complete len:261 (+) Transcript_33017:1233-2015(+)